MIPTLLSISVYSQNDSPSLPDNIRMHFLQFKLLAICYYSMFTKQCARKLSQSQLPVSVKFI